MSFPSNAEVQKARSEIEALIEGCDALVLLDPHKVRIILHHITTQAKALAQAQTEAAVLSRVIDVMDYSGDIQAIPERLAKALAEKDKKIRELRQYFGLVPPADCELRALTAEARVKELAAVAAEYSRVYGQTILARNAALAYNARLIEWMRTERGCRACAGGTTHGPQSFQTQCKGCVDNSNWTPPVAKEV